MASENIGLQRFEMENKIETIDRAFATDEIYRYDALEQESLRDQAPWKQDVHYFKKARISAIALIKMAMHAKSGDRLEVMGLLQGKVEGDILYVMDSFALPVEGTETRVNAQAEAYEYAIAYRDKCEAAGRRESPIGWYHSHPGYGCWLSGIDVATQMMNQSHMDPWLAIVVDPKRTETAGKVEIGAFRTYPEGYKPPNESSSEYQVIPLDKIEDFGVHHSRYYALETSFFKSSLDQQLLDLLWHQYWINTLASSAVIANRDYFTGQIRDLADKLEQADNKIAQSSRIGSHLMSSKGEENQITKLSRDARKLAVEQSNGLMALLVKDMLFNWKGHRENDKMDL